MLQHVTLLEARNCAATRWGAWPWGGGRARVPCSVLLLQYAGQQVSHIDRIQRTSNN